MSIFSWFQNCFSSTFGGRSQSTTGINPASGLPMAVGFDIQGNPFGTNLHSHHGSFISHDSHQHWCSNHYDHLHRSGGSSFNDW